MTFGVDLFQSRSVFEEVLSVNELLSILSYVVLGILTFPHLIQHILQKLPSKSMAWLVLGSIVVGSSQNRRPCQGQIAPEEGGSVLPMIQLLFLVPMLRYELSI
jgi:uncharacterized membrane protein